MGSEMCIRDRYKDHLYCAEYLFSKGLSGIFFPPINILKKGLLDVNAIHYLIGQKDVNLKLILDFIIDKINPGPHRGRLIGPLVPSS